MSSSPYTETYITGPQKTQFYARTYFPSAPPKALVIAIHGFNEHIGRFTHVHSIYAQRGIAVFAFDQRGFGLTAKKKENGDGKGYAKTSWKEQLEDMEWAVKQARGLEGCKDIPVFMYGHSMGGALTLAFATRKGPAWPHPSQETISLLSGVVVTSPLISQSKPANKIVRWFGDKISIVSPGIIIPAEVKGSDLSHDPNIGEAYVKDPLIRQVGSLRGVSDMLDGGEHLLRKDYQNWPKNLPILLVHGTEDRVTSHKSSETFFAEIVADDKKLSLYEGGYHELHNEPDGVKEKLIEECVSWIEAHITASSKL